MSPLEFTRRVEQVAAAADAAIDDAGRYQAAIAKALRNIERRAKRHRERMETAKGFQREQLEREAKIIEGIVRQIRSVA